MPTISVKDGSVKVNSGWLRAEGDGFRWYAFDLRAKYAEIMALDSNKVCVGRGTDTLHYEAGIDEPTEISFDGLPTDETVWDATISRYTLNVYIGTRSDSAYKMVYERPREPNDH